MSRDRIVMAFGLAAGLCLLALFGARSAQPQNAPKYKVDADWPKPLPNKWKMGGVTGLAVDKDDNVWVHDRPNDLTDIELEAELTPPIADCCVRPPSMIHIDEEGNAIGSLRSAPGSRRGPAAGFLPNGGAKPDPAAVAAREAATVAFRAKYPPTTPMIVGGIEEVRLDEPAHELYAADNYLGGRVMVFDMDSFQFKRGWGAYGHKLSEITTDDKNLPS